MSHKWNVYKVFKSGKRAKAPFCVMEGESEEKAKEKFLGKYISNADSKLNKHTWSFIREDMSQERVYEKNLEKENETTRKKNNFLGILLFCFHVFCLSFLARNSYRFLMTFDIILDIFS